MKNNTNTTIALARLIEDAMQAAISRLPNETSLNVSYRYSPGGYPTARFSLAMGGPDQRCVELMNAFAADDIRISFQTGYGMRHSVPNDKFYQAAGDNTLATIVSDITEFLFHQLTMEFAKELADIENYRNATGQGNRFGRPGYGPGSSGYGGFQAQQPQQAELPAEEPKFTKTFGAPRIEQKPVDANIVTLDMNNVYRNIFMAAAESDTGAGPDLTKGFLTADKTTKAPAKRVAVKAAKPAAK